ncbi:hypothetical protein [Streptomyces natalensis]|uniref:Uncharacterized protein n=1 Tax=Streptomyces natalensis ATCC 27448 TaxID=1240678 RepID=A0A0D7CPI7_9ACTN|nr:hypothetical protein [Streptomyces natalensis]KIZ17307.1 hypothetical protein SNA_14875 [Streptomyces natalensis ATCC 27448]
MAEAFNCEYDPDVELKVRQDPDGFVEISVEDPTPPGAPGVSLAAYLKPESARRFARAVTLASFEVEGEPLDDVLQGEALAIKETMETGSPSEPCPETNHRCDPMCSARAECHRSAMKDLFRSPDKSVVFTDEMGNERAEAFLAARELAGPAANLDDVLTLADYLAA